MELLNDTELDGKTKSYCYALTLFGASVCLWSAWAAAFNLNVSQWAQLLALFGFVAIAASRPFRIPGTSTQLTVGDTFIFLGIIMFGVPAGVLLAALDAFVGCLRIGKSNTRRLYSVAIVAASTFLSGATFLLTLNATTNHTLDLNALSLVPQHVELGQLIVPVMAMTLVQYLCNGFAIATFFALRTQANVWRVWRDNYLWTSWTFFAAAIAAVLVREAISSFGLLQVLLSVPVVLATYASYKIYFERVSEKSREVAEMGRLHLATVEALATAIDAKDQTTHCHVRRVQHYAAGVGKLLNLAAPEIEALKAGALLHDIGKLAVPDHILNKPGKLTTAEFEKMKIHTTVGAQILERVDFPYPVAPIVRYHHERWDGFGYPEGLKGEEIPLTARILAVVDSFDSVREDRPYRLGLSVGEASRMLRSGAGTHFDPQVVELFLENLDEFNVGIIDAGLDTHGFTEEECEPRSLVVAQTLHGTDNNIHTTERPRPTTGQLTDAPTYLDQIKNAHREVYALYEIARTFSSSLNVADISTLLVNKVEHIVPFTTCAVYLFDESNGTARAQHAAGRHADLVRGRTIKPDKGAVGFTLANRRATTQFDPMFDFRDIELPEATHYVSMAALPLMKDEKLYGALAVYSTELDNYTDEHMRLLDMVARIASDALANAVRHAESESNALTDQLTGLPNARALQLRFEEEAARARRTGKTFEVIMLDLDDFKQVNDTYGHKTGDQVLCEASRVLQAQLREYDFLARYAGDEFVAIVQDLSGEQATELRERIEKSIGNLSVHVRADKMARIGISCGAAVYNVHGTTLDALLVHADEAMYSVKSVHKRGANPVATKHNALSELDTASLASTAIN